MTKFLQIAVGFDVLYEISRNLVGILEFSECRKHVDRVDLIHSSTPNHSKFASFRCIGFSGYVAAEPRLYRGCDSAVISPHGPSYIYVGMIFRLQYNRDLVGW